MLRGIIGSHDDNRDAFVKCFKASKDYSSEITEVADLLEIETIPKVIKSVKSFNKLLKAIKGDLDSCQYTGVDMKVVNGLVKIVDSPHDFV